MNKPLLFTLTVALSAGAAHAQDDSCSSATPIAGTGSFPFTTFGATDSGLIASCNSAPSADAWFAWTPAVSGNFRLSVCSASYDVVIAVYDACGGTELACDDGFATGFGNCLGTVNDVAVSMGGLVGGTTYLVQLDGWQGDTGFGTLDIDLLPPGPGNDECVNATAIAGIGSFPISNISATDSGTTPACGAGPSADSWYAWTPATSDNYQLSVCAASYDIVIAAYDTCGGTLLGCSDGFANGFGACSGTVNDVLINLPNLIGGVTYMIQIDGWVGDTGTGTLDIAIGSPPPANDECVNAIPIAGVGSFPVSNVGASDSGSPPSCGTASGADTWYVWTPATTDNYKLSICSASFDVVIAVYDACGGIQLDCSDGFATGVGTCSGTVNDVAVNLPNLIGGTPYLIQVDGWNGATGSGMLDIAPYVPPANDDCSNATPIAGEGTFIVDNTNGTAGVVASCAAGPSTDVWYAWTSGASIDYRFQICGAPFDEVISIWDGCGGLELGCNDVALNGCGGGVFDVEVDLFGLMPNTTYLIQVDGWAGGTGTAVMDITALSPPPTVGTNYCIGVVNSTGMASTITAMGSASISANDLVLTADNLPSQPGIFIAGPGQSQVPFFNGFLCIDPNGLQRFLNTASPSAGVITEAVDYGTSAAGGLNVMAGSTYNFQRWNRDPAGGGGNANFSDGLAVDMLP